MPDLIDATEFIVAVLRPAVELAESTNVAVARIQRIIARREFAIYLQPIVRLGSGAVVASEALTRFRDGTPPDVVFAEAALLGLGANLQRATVAAAIEAAASRPTGEALSVNLSAAVIQREPTLAGLIAGTRRPLIVEITETAFAEEEATVAVAEPMSRKTSLRSGPSMNSMSSPPLVGMTFTSSSPRCTTALASRNSPGSPLSTSRTSTSSGARRRPRTVICWCCRPTARGS